MKKDWTYKKLGDIATFSRGLTYAKEDVADLSSKKVLRSNNIDLASHTLNFDNVACLNEGFSIPADKILRKGDIFICMSNGSTQHLGKVAFIANDIDYAFGGFMGAIHPDSIKTNPKFVYYALLSKEYRRFLASILNGININNLKWSELLKFTIPVPNELDEQSKISSELDLLQSIIAKQKAQLQELDNLAQAVFFDIFGDPVENNKKWDKKRIDEIGEIVSGSTPSTTDESNWNGDVNWITPAEMGVQLYYGETQRKITKKAAKSLTLMPVGTVLLSSRAPIGKLAISTVPMCCNQGFKNIICGKSINNIFMYYYLMLTMDNVIALGRGATFKEVSKQGISAYNVIVPPLPLQQSFAAKIESIEKQKAAINKSIEESQKLFDYTMDRYFG